MKKFLHKQREIVAIVLYMGIIAALVYFVVFPLIGRIDEINNKMQEESARQENIGKQISELPKIKKQYQALEDNQDLNTVLLDRNEAVILIEKLEKLADQTNNKITISIQDAPVAEQKKTAQATGKASTEKLLTDDLPNKNFLQMKITLDGNYNSIINFMRSLESFEYYGDIIGIQIDNSSSSSSQNKNAAVVGTSNPFNASVATDSATNQDDPAKTDALTASLDTVFYTR